MREEMEDYSLLSDKEISSWLYIKA
jgi:hypothetical protein